jgi:hypothetical protein
MWGDTRRGRATKPAGAAAPFLRSSEAILVRGPPNRGPGSAVLDAIEHRQETLRGLRAKTLAARRDRLLAMRSKGVIGDEAFHRLEEELDLSDVAVATRMQA